MPHQHIATVGADSRPKLLLLVLVMALDDETLETFLEKSDWFIQLVREELKSREDQLVSHD